MLETVVANESRTVPGTSYGYVNNRGKIRTLIVDDQLMARELLRRTLKDETDIEIIGMPASGSEAVEAINTLEPDLVFLDVQMPELDGFGVLSQINRRKMPVIIFVTGSAMFDRDAVS